MAPTIRQATALDLERMAAMREMAWHESYEELVPEEVLDWLDARRSRTVENWRKMLLDGTHFWIAVDGDEIVGLSQACPRGDDDIDVLLEVDMLYVRQAYKGSGLADALLKTAIAFYRRHGFVEDEVRRDVPNMPPTVRERRLVRRTEKG
jgi:2-(1,2-epoxy-1,2-dihydrophenyl)acetyl-CoA isomerase